jgi:hypoxanthine phosphoribosyltransferase
MKVKNVGFVEFISASEIDKKIKKLSIQVNKDYKGKSPLFLPILNGSFIFASDLIKEITVQCKISFVKINSYSGTQSTGQLKTLIGLDESLFNQDIVIVEDIIDTGLTLKKIMDELKGLGTKSVEVISLLRKQPARDKNIAIKYVGFEIENEFVLGYGMDYEGMGRNTKNILKKVDQ